VRVRRCCPFYSITSLSRSFKFAGVEKRGMSPCATTVRHSTVPWRTTSPSTESHDAPLSLVSGPFSAKAHCLVGSSARCFRLAQSIWRSLQLLAAAENFAVGGDDCALLCIKNASERSESGRLAQERSGTRHRENPCYIGLFSSHTERPGPLGGTSNPAGAKFLKRCSNRVFL
jgi:hypothetical protein